MSACAWRVTCQIRTAILERVVEAQGRIDAAPSLVDRRIAERQYRAALHELADHHCEPAPAYLADEILADVHKLAALFSRARYAVDMQVAYDDELAKLKHRLSNLWKTK